MKSNEINRTRVRSNEIKGARVRLGLTQSDMAKLLNLTPQSYSNKELGKFSFTEEEKFKLGEVLGFTLVQMNDFLFDGKLPSGTIED